MARLRWISIVALAVGLIASAAGAQTPVSSEEPLVIPCDVTDTSGGGVTLSNPCTIQDFFNQFIVLAQWGLSLVVVLAVLMLLWGGIQWITAGGRASKIEEGKRIVLGTIIGVMISFSAYVIINFTVSAITGTSTRSNNPFAGPIATIFGDQPFSGNIQNTGQQQCRKAGDASCSNQIKCVDPGTTPGAITALQNLLNAKGCNCGGADGCFGPQTVACLQRYQIANQLPPTGFLDAETSQLLDQSQFGPTTQGARCTVLANDLSSPTQDLAAQSLSVVSSLPAASQNNGGDKSATGCCVIYRGDPAGGQPLFCADQMTERVCLSYGKNNTFVENSTSCMLDAKTSDVCGFCHASEQKCFGQSTQFWCENVVGPDPIAFISGPALGRTECPSATSYIESLRTSKP